MKTKNKYDTALIWLFAEGKEHLVPKPIRSGIPHSTISTWRNTDCSAYYGHELRVVHQQALEYYELFEKYTSLKKTVLVLARVWKTISGLVLPVLQKKKDFEENYLNLVQLLFTVFRKRDALKWAGISASSFSLRMERLKFRCGISRLQLCLKRHPLQLARCEVEKIKGLFADTDLTCWPASSLYYEGLRRRGLYISLSTFYKYVQVLGLKRKWKKAAKNPEGLRAKMPNQYIHVDTTYWTLENGKKAAVAFVSDNFSRAIIGWNMSLKNGAVNVIPALQKAVKTITSFYPIIPQAVLVADGGSENHAERVESLLRETNVPAITKVIARKDIRFSNSPVEAINKIVKRYLRHFKPTTFEALKECLIMIEKDYNQKRPHGSLAGLTPMEAYKEPVKTLDFSSQKRTAKAIRIAQNQKTTCNTCQK